MSVKVMWGKEGPYAVADTPEEALKLIKLGSNGFGGVHASSDADPSPVSLGEDQRVLKLFIKIHPKAKRFLIALSNHKEGIDADKIAEELQAETHGFGGMLGGVSKLAAKYNLDFKGFVFSEMKIEDSRRYRFYKPASMLLKYATVLKDGLARK